MRVRLEGFSDLDKALGQLGKATGRNVLRRAGMEALKPMAAHARQMAPDDPNGPKPDLSESIAVTTKLSRRARGMNRRGKSEVEVYMGPAGVGGELPPAHGSFQEFGTVHHAPQPFMRPAWDAGKGRVLDHIKDALGSQIEIAAKRQAKKQARLIAKTRG